MCSSDLSVLELVRTAPRDAKLALTAGLPVARLVLTATTKPDLAAVLAQNLA